MKITAQVEVLAFSARPAVEQGKLVVYFIGSDHDMFALAMHLVHNLPIQQVESLQTIVNDRIRGESW